MALTTERPSAANAVQAAKARQAATRPRRLPVSDLKRRGWTDAMVSRLLGKPDASEPNPYYPRNGAPMKLYSFGRVAAAEASPAFLAWYDRLERKRQVASR